MKRERGIELLHTVLTSAAQAEERPLTLLDAIHVFGSFARGALEPHDVELDFELTIDDEFASDIVWSLSRGQDPYAPVRHALIGRRRGVQFRFNELAMLRDAGSQQRCYGNAARTWKPRSHGSARSSRTPRPDGHRAT